MGEHQQRPHIDQQAGYDFIVLLFPVYSKKTREIIPGEVDFAVGDGFLVGVGVEGIPFRHHPYGFWIVASLMVLASVFLIVIFKLKKWF